MTSLPGDEFRAVENIHKPDVRNSTFGLKNIDNLYQEVSAYELNDDVPDKIVIQYDVARNIYLYSFHVYRFYMVAQHHALTSLELAIREYAGNEVLEEFRKEKKLRRGLKLCLEFVREKKLVSSEDFSVWKNRNKMYAKHKYEMNKSIEMEEKGLKEIELNYNDIDYEQYNIEWDYLKTLCDILPQQRNEHAHGTSMLHNQVIIVFDIVSTIINKIYSKG